MPTFNLSDLRATALSRVDNNSSLYTNDELDWVINEVVRIVALFTGFYRVTANISGGSVANQLIYSCPTGIFVPYRVILDGRDIPRSTFRDLVRTRRKWATDTTASKGQVETWAPIGNTMFVMYPILATSGRTITVVGRGEPPALVNPTDVVTLENEYVEIIAEYCDHRLPLKEGGKLFADGSLALNDFYRNMVERKALESWKRPKYWLLEPKAKDVAQT